MVSRVWITGFAFGLWAIAAVGAGAQLICSYDQLCDDWISQQRVRGTVSGGPAPTLEEDALGGCDGVKDGRWGFHTDADLNPWWQVDLGEPMPLALVDVYNRADGAAERTSRIICWVSDDGRAWREVYRHNGKVFLGYPDGKPLRIAMDGTRTRYVRLGLEGTSYFHLDEVEVYPPGDGAPNVALGKAATQSSLSQWSVKHYRTIADPVTPEALAELARRGLRLAEDLAARGVDVSAGRGELEEVAAAVRALPDGAAYADREALLLRARAATRALALANPLLDFDRLLFVKRVPGSFSHMSDQNYGWWSRPGGGIYILDGFRSDTPGLRCLTESFPPGTFANPDLSYDGTRVVFAYCRYYPDLAAKPDKLDKASIPEDAFYHVYEMGIDGTGLRQLTTGRYDDFDARYLPSGEIVFLSTRRGQFLQCGFESAMATLTAALPDSFVRCGGDAYRPVSVYTLHVMDADGQRIRAISPFENFEWTPSVAGDGRILYARWDYVDRSNTPYMGLWSTNPDGTEPVAVYGNFTPSPHCVFEARPVPGSRKLMFTASAHHCITAGSIVLLDPARGVDGSEPMERLTPEVCFPEAEGWPTTYFANPYPLSEEYYLAAWSDVPLVGQGGLQPPDAMGVYLGDAFGNLDLLYRDPEISSMYPIPVRPRPVPPVLSSAVAPAGAEPGRLVLLNVGQGLQGVPAGTVRALRVIGVPPKVQPVMNSPVLGVTGDDPGKFVLGTVPVEADGSAHFSVPSGLPVFFQALDGDGLAIQTMRSVTYVQPGQTLSCIGCHEPRTTAPANLATAAGARPPSPLAPGPEGSWPLRYDRLVQPVLDRLCVSCHSPEASGPQAAAPDLTSGRSYDALVAYGSPSLADHVRTRYAEGRSAAGAGAARTSALLALLRADDGHHGVRLSADDQSRLATWTDTYAQRQGSYSDEQERLLEVLRARSVGLLAASP